MLLERLREVTVSALGTLIDDNCPGISVPEHRWQERDLDGMRMEMAEVHRTMVELLASCIGEERAVEKGRDLLRQVGIEMGREARERLGVDDSMEDVLRAARILYRVLGIDFYFRPGEKEGTLLVRRCALSDAYTDLTCRVMSATDEGVLKGLNDDLDMRFVRTITGGSERCEAKVIIEGER
jgi:hypothetical protein